MSNRLVIRPTIFESYPDGDKSYGVRIYDDEDAEYMNHWDLEDLDLGPLEILQKVLEEASEEVLEMLDHVRSYEKGIQIGNNWYDWDKIKSVLEEEEVSL